MFPLLLIILSNFLQMNIDIAIYLKSGVSIIFRFLIGTKIFLWQLPVDSVEYKWHRLLYVLPCTDAINTRAVLTCDLRY